MVTCTCADGFTGKFCETVYCDAVWEATSFGPTWDNSSAWNTTIYPCTSDVVCIPAAVCAGCGGERELRMAAADRTNLIPSPPLLQGPLIAQDDSVGTDGLTIYPGAELRIARNGELLLYADNSDPCPDDFYCMASSPCQVCVCGDHL